MKKTLLMLLAVGSIRIISETYESELFDEVMDANDWEAEPNKHIFEFQVSPEVDQTDQWALDLSGFVAYVSGIEEFVDAVNLEFDGDEKNEDAE